MANEIFSGHCKDCRWMGVNAKTYSRIRKNYVDTKFHYCARIERDAEEMADDMAVADIILVKPEFGCALFEEKK